MRDLDQALRNVNQTYEQLLQVQNPMIQKVTFEVDQIISDLNDNLENLSNERIRESMLKLSLKAYTFSDTKERSSLVAECAEILRKESYADSFNKADGSVAQRENTALLNSSEQVLVEQVYDMVSSQLKTKLDEIHRVVDALKSVIVSRMSEAKLVASTDGCGE